MFGLFKRNKRLPNFDALLASGLSEKYFIRTASWRRLDRVNIMITDSKSPRVFTLDTWPQMVFVAADGQYTVREYVHHMALQYSGNVPDNLDTTILQQLETLANHNIIRLVDSKRRPAPEHDRPQD
jgi:hypothetical protein